MIGPAKRLTRLGSIREKMANEKANEAALKNKLDYYANKITRIKTQVEVNETFQTWPKFQIEDRLKALEAYGLAYQTVELDAEILEEESADGKAARLTQSETIEDAVTALVVILRERLHELSLADQGVAKKAENLHVQVQSSTVINTWGTFDGNYAFWPTFRDLFIAGVHNNESIKAINKFQYLIASCIGEAKTALGEWVLSEENYVKAWNRLKATYEDTYMQIQAFMRNLFGIARIQVANKASIRKLIDDVSKSVNGLSRCMNKEHIDTFVAFLVIDKMDRETYRSWEKHRQMLIKEIAQARGDGAQGGLPENAFIPKWEHLEKFLENEYSIHIHDEKSQAHSMQNQQPNQANQANYSMNRSMNANMNANRKVPEHWSCILCPMTHPIHKCNVFRAMPLAQRRDHMNRHNLCDRCLKPYHAELNCDPKGPTLPCMKCGDKNGRRYHNSLLCPTREAELRAALLTHDASRVNKRENQNNETA